MAITKFSSIQLNVSDGNTVPAIDFLEYPVFPDIGSGTVARLYWDTPVASGNTVDYYKLTITAYIPSSNSYLSVFTGNIGTVNEYYITSSLLSSVKLANYKLYVYLTAISKYGATYDSPTSNTVVYVCDACGTYIKVSDGYTQPIMKRSVAFAKLGYKLLHGEDGKILTDENGKALYGKASSVQDDENGWTPMQDFCTKDQEGNWQKSDIRYEVLVDNTGTIITDSNNNAIYTL